MIFKAFFFWDLPIIAGNILLLQKPLVCEYCASIMEDYLVPLLELLFLGKNPAIGERASSKILHDRNIMLVGALNSLCYWELPVIFYALLLWSSTSYRVHSAIGKSQPLEAPLIGNDLLLRTHRFWKHSVIRVFDNHKPSLPFWNEPAIGNSLSLEAPLSLEDCYLQRLTTG